MAQTKAFNGQRDGEELLFVFRRHIIAMRKGFYMLLVPLAVGAIPPLIWQDRLELCWLPVVGLVLGSIGLCYHLLLWRYPYYIVTHQRIHPGTQQGVFGTDVMDLSVA